jgi:hypothetical protein
MTSLPATCHPFYPFRGRQYDTSVDSRPRPNSSKTPANRAPEAAPALPVEKADRAVPRQKFDDKSAAETKKTPRKPGRRTRKLSSNFAPRKSALIRPAARFHAYYPIAENSRCRDLGFLSGSTSLNSTCCQQFPVLEKALEIGGRR